MKGTNLAGMIALALVLAAPAARAQKTIKLEESLQKNSAPMPARRKGISAVGNYVFGPYHVVSGKTGWTTTRTRAPLFGSESSSTSQTRKSFVFANASGDTATGNIFIHSFVETDRGSLFSRMFLNWHWEEVVDGEEVFECAFAFSSDTSLWHMALVYPVAYEQADGTLTTDRHTTFQGALSNGSETFEIRQSMERADGKKSLVNPYLGYGIYRNGIETAAVQVMPANKLIVWIDNSLDQTTTFLMASAITALLIKTM